MRTMLSFFFDLILWGAVGGFLFLVWG